MKRSSSAPCLAEDELDNNQRKRIKGSSEEEGPNTREYLQLALARVLQLQRAVNDDSYFDETTSDLGDSDNDDDLMSHVIAKVFRDLPGSSTRKVTEIIERGTRTRHAAEIERVRSKGVQLSGYDTCRRVAVDFMKRAVKAQKLNHRRSIDDFPRRSAASVSSDVRTRMLSSLDLHLANKQRDYTARLMRH